jgi:hypothetical protein
MRADTADTNAKLAKLGQTLLGTPESRAHSAPGGGDNRGLRRANVSK